MMNKEDMFQLVKQSTELMQKYNLTTQEASQVMMDISNNLAQSLNQTKSDMQQLFKETKTHLQQTAKAAIHETIDSEMTSFEQRTHASVQAIQGAATHIEHAKKGLARNTGILIGVAVVCVGILSIGSVGIASYVIKQKRDEYNQIEYRQEVKSILNTLKIHNCSEQVCFEISNDMKLLSSGETQYVVFPKKIP